MFIVFDAVNIMYICVFMTCSTSYYLCDTLQDLWNLCTCACMYNLFQSVHILQSGRNILMSEFLFHVCMMV
jgi:hypothetical protein